MQQYLALIFRQLYNYKISVLVLVPSRCKSAKSGGQQHW